MWQKGPKGPFFVQRLMQESTTNTAFLPDSGCLVGVPLERLAQSRQQWGNIEATAMSGIKLGYGIGNAPVRASLKDNEL